MNSLDMLLVVLFYLLQCSFAVYQPNLRIDYLSPLVWTNEPSVWRDQLNVTIPDGGWDGHWTQYRPFVRDLIRVAKAERPYCEDCSTPLRLPRQLTPIAYQRIYRYAVEYGHDPPPSLYGFQFETNVIDNGYITCVAMMPSNDFYIPSDDVRVICAPTNGTKTYNDTCLDYDFYDLFSIHQSIELIILTDFGSDRCHDSLYGVYSRNLLVVNSHVRLKNLSQKIFMTFVHSKLKLYGPLDLFDSTVGFVHLTDGSELVGNYPARYFNNIWKVVRVTDNSKFVLKQRSWDLTRIWIEALICDNSSLCQTQNVKVTQVATGNFDYVQETYDFLKLYFESNEHPLTWYEYPEYYPGYNSREPCPAGSRLTLLTGLNQNRCIRVF